MSTSPDVIELRDAVQRAFADVPQPPPDQIAPHECDECAELRAALAGIDWRTMPASFITSHEGSLPLLTPEALAYYLPGYLLYGLDHPDAFAIELMIYYMRPSDESHWDGRDEWHRRQFSQLTAAQLDAVTEVLRFVAARAEDDWLRREIGLAREQLARYRAERG